ncbi:extracellular solute-binding protein [Paraclostridium bifermentans]|uniref:extracellular solute-binding protein n=1 Tax=Paraclostridium bifermentans TaxID=1490 RepID=UPI00359C9D19
MKKRRIMSFIIGASLVLALTGCSSKADTKENSQNSNLEEKLVIYSTHPEDLLESVATDFEKETGVKVEFINLKGQLAEKIEAEKNDPQADIMYGGSSATYLELASKDVFEKTQPSWAKDLDPLFKSKDDLWYGTIQTPVMMFYNSEMLSKDQAPKDWSDLADAKFKDQLVFRNAGSSSAKATYSSLLYQYDKEGKMAEGWEYMKKLDNNTKKYYESGSLQFQAIGRKEASVSFAVLSSIIDNKNNGLPLEIVNATSGNPVITDGVAKIKNCKNPKAADAFMDYIGSVDTQAKIANEFDRMPTLEAAIKKSPKWMQDAKYKVMDVDWSVIAEKQGEWMQKWDSEIKDSNKDIK